MQQATHAIAEIKLTRKGENWYAVDISKAAWSLAHSVWEHFSGPEFQSYFRKLSIRIFIKILSTVVNTVYVCTCLSVHVHMFFYVFTFMQLYSFVLGLKILDEWSICILWYFMFFFKFTISLLLLLLLLFISATSLSHSYLCFYLSFCFIQSVPMFHLLILLFPLPFLIS